MDSCDVLKESNFTSVWLGPFAVDADSIYYVHSALHDTKKKPKTCLAVGGFGLAAEPAQGVAVDDTYLFWVMPDGTVRRHDKNVSNLDAAAITLWDGRGALASQHRLVLSPNDVFAPPRSRTEPSRSFPSWGALCDSSHQVKVNPAPSRSTLTVSSIGRTDSRAKSCRWILANISTASLP